MDDKQLTEAMERLVDALEDLNVVRDCREDGAQADMSVPLDRLTSGDEALLNVDKPHNDGQLRMALRHIDAARGLVVNEINDSVPESHRESRNISSSEGDR